MRISTVCVQVSKELDQFRRDRLTVALAVVLPVAAMLMYGLAARLEAKDIGVAVINYDGGKVGRELVDRIFATVQLIPVANVAGAPERTGCPRSREGRLFTLLDRSAAKATVVIPPDFSKNLQAGRTATYQAVIDGTDVNNARVIKNALVANTQIFERLSGLSAARPLVQTATRLWYNPGRKESLYIVPGAVALVLWIFPALLSVLALVREKEQGTILQVYASNLTALEFMGGKAVAYIIVGLLEFFCLLFTAMIVFGLELRGGIFIFALCTILYIASGVLFGLAAGMKANTQMAGVQLVANIGFLTTMLFSGFIYPLRNIVFPLSLLAYGVPAMYYVRVCRNEFVAGGSWLGLWYAPLFLLFLDLLLLFAVSRMKMRLAY